MPRLGLDASCTELLSPVRQRERITRSEVSLDRIGHRVDPPRMGLICWFRWSLAWLHEPDVHLFASRVLARTIVARTRAIEA